MGQDVFNAESVSKAFATITNSKGILLFIPKKNLMLANYVAEGLHNLRV
jgi:hypothetical protein